MNKSEYKFVFFAFLIWRVGLFVILHLAVKFVPMQSNFLGGGLGNYITNPNFWAYGNYDGQHYVNIAQNGYGFGEYAFFPLYPLIIRFVGGVLGRDIWTLNLIGQMVSNVAFLIGVTGFYKLARLDFKQKISKAALMILLLFPTSFYFASVYTESIFFAILVWAFYFVRQKKFLYASILGLFLTMARPIGIFLFPAILAEVYITSSKKVVTRKFPVSIFLMFFGLGSYMYYLKTHLNDSLAFFHQLDSFGEQRSTKLVTLPQVIYRYIFKIFPNINLTYFPVAFFTSLEFFVSIVYLVLLIILFFKGRLSYFIFSFLAFITPTLTGSFSSMPRYVLVLFPAYFLMAFYLYNRKSMFFVFCLLSFILLIVSFSLFARGYWIS